MKLTFNKYVALIVALLIFNSCGMDYLEVPTKGSALEADYYKDRSEAYAGLIAVYDVLGFSSGLVTKIGALNSASDDHLAGGGNSTDMNSFQVWSNYTLNPAVGPQDALWAKGFSGVFRANVLLQKLADVPMDDTEKARFTAEAKFLRAYFYFDLVRLFKNVPLLLEPVNVDKMYDIEQASPADVYAQIIKDIKEALPVLPNKVPGTEAARMTAGAAHALLGRVYLWQEKFTEAAQELAIVNGTPGVMNPTYGYKLMDNFADLFDAKHKFNTESIFEISHTNTSAGNWGCGDCTEGNILAVMAGPRGYKITAAGQGLVPDFVSGWSFFAVTPSLVSVMESDPRYASTVVNIGKMAADGLVEYTPGYMDTGYFLKKYAGLQENKSNGAGNWELNYPHNDYEIRLADTYLMEAEALVRGSGDAGRAQALLDAVRARVGLGSVPATFDNIFNERRFELLGEGHRWLDLVRTGRAADALKTRGFVAGKHEVLPIPLKELENTKIKQNVEYGG
jgi:hypothetical protein